MGLLFHSAEWCEVEKFSRSLLASRICTSAEEVALVHKTQPWRIQVSKRADVAFLSVWRDHLRFLALDVFWCRTKVIPEAIAQLRALAAQHGYSDLVSPLTPLEDIGPYIAGGMRVEQRLASYQVRRHEARLVTLKTACPQDVTLRSASRADIPCVLSLDAASFLPFWRYDRRHLEHLCADSRIVIAERCGAAVGYTLANASKGEGVLGRVCVIPEARRSGVGSLLVADALQALFGCGCDRVTLNTQVENTTAQSVYIKAGFWDTGRQFAFLRFGHEAVEEVVV